MAESKKKISIITGSSKGIGKAIAMCLQNQSNILV
jgi:NADP-dependent 3-hydroxy acid dehydrogenase YdfG